MVFIIADLILRQNISKKNEARDELNTYFQIY